MATATTPLHAASEIGDADTCSKLLLLTTAGADDVNAVDGVGDTPLHLAAERGSEACVPGCEATA